MALDNAQFIAELSITDPPGSDPLSQGDDQIRTIKRATQQSFPNIDAAVTLTTAQMNLVAIKNEANAFTANQTINERLFLGRNTDAGFCQWTLRDEGGVNIWTCFMDTLANGNDLVFNRLIGGVTQDEPIRIDNTTGIVDFAQVPTVAGDPLWVAGELRMFVIAATPGANWFIANGTNGTVDINDRVLTATGLSSVGTLLAPNLVGTAASGTSGSTAITESQMPDHGHRIWSGNATNGITDVTFATALTVVGANRGNTSRGYTTVVSGSSTNIIDTTGGGGGHTHSQSSVSVTENGSDRNTVRPLSIAVSMFQYVP